MTVQEAGKGPQQCKVLSEVIQPDGTKAYELEDLQTHEHLTIVEAGKASEIPTQTLPSKSSKLSNMFRKDKSQAAPAGEITTAPVMTSTETKATWVESKPTAAAETTIVPATPVTTRVEEGPTVVMPPPGQSPHGPRILNHSVRDWLRGGSGKKGPEIDPASKRSESAAAPVPAAPTLDTQPTVPTPSITTGAKGTVKLTSREKNSAETTSGAKPADKTGSEEKKGTPDGVQLPQDSDWHKSWGKANDHTSRAAPKASTAKTQDLPQADSNRPDPLKNLELYGKWPVDDPSTGNGTPGTGMGINAGMTPAGLAGYGTPAAATPTLGSPGAAAPGKPTSPVINGANYLTTPPGPQPVIGEAKPAGSTSMLTPPWIQPGQPGMYPANFQGPIAPAGYDPRQGGGAVTAGYSPNQAGGVPDPSYFQGQGGVVANPYYHQSAYAPRPAGPMNPTISQVGYFPAQGAATAPPTYPSYSPSQYPVAVPARAATLPGAAPVFARQTAAPKIPAQVPAAELPDDMDTSTDTLLTMLRGGLFPSHREWAADHLAGGKDLDSPMVAEALARGARLDPAASVRTACILGLVQVKSNEALVRETLQALRADRDPGVRHEADQALAHLPPAPAAVPPLPIQPVSAPPALVTP